MVIVNSLFPVFTLIVIGVWLKRVGLTNATFLAMVDRLVYFILFPILLFWKIGGSRGLFNASLAYCAVAVTVVAIIFVVSTLFIIFGKVGDFQAGTFSQSCYRFNTYVGMAVALTVLGEKGVQYFSILIGILIPIINVMAVSILIWYGKKREGTKKQLLNTLKAIGTNPLFLACVAGMIYARMIGFFPTAIDNTLQLLSMATLPLALISIGGMLTLKMFVISATGADRLLFQTGVVACVRLLFVKVDTCDGNPISGKYALLFCLLHRPCMYSHRNSIATRPWHQPRSFYRPCSPFSPCRRRFCCFDAGNYQARIQGKV